MSARPGTDPPSLGRTIFVGAVGFVGLSLPLGEFVKLGFEDVDRPPVLHLRYPVDSGGHADDTECHEEQERHRRRRHDGKSPDDLLPEFEVAHDPVDGTRGYGYLKMNCCQSSKSLMVRWMVPRATETSR